MKALSVAGNMLVFTLITTAISKTVQWIDDYIHRVEKAKEAIFDITSEINDLNDGLKSTQKTIKNSAQRFAELSQGVNQLTGANKTLSTDDYEEFLDLSNQIAELFPTLPRIYDENGNAVVQLSGDVDTIVGSLNNLVEVQRQVANQEIADKLPDLYKNLKTVNKGYEEQLELAEFNVNKYQSVIKKLSSASSWEEINANASDNYEDNVIMRQIAYDWGFFADENLDASIEEAIEYYQRKLKEANSEVQTINSDIQSNWSNLNQSLFAWLSTNENYSVWSDDLQAGIQTAINSINWSELNLDDDEQVKQHILDNIVNPIQDNQEVKDAFTELFTLESGNLNRVEIAKNLQNLLNDLGIEFNVMPIVADEQDAKNRLENSIRKLTDDHGISNREEYANLIELTKDFTMAQVRLIYSVHYTI